MNWQEAEVLYPGCGVGWDIYWEKIRETCPHNLTIELSPAYMKYHRGMHDSLYDETRDLWVMDIPSVNIQFYYDNPYRGTAYTIGYWHAKIYSCWNQPQWTVFAFNWRPEAQEWYG